MSTWNALETARHFRISVQRVCELCRKGRIVGAHKPGRAGSRPEWIIPANPVPRILSIGEWRAKKGKTKHESK